MAGKGAALSFRQADLTAEALAAALEKLVASADLRAEMGRKMRDLAQPDAAQTVAEWCRQNARS